jgi:hypothetical protein
MKPMELHLKNPELLNKQIIELLSNPDLYSLQESELDKFDESKDEDDLMTPNLIHHLETVKNFYSFKTFIPKRNIKCRVNNGIEKNLNIVLTEGIDYSSSFFLQNDGLVKFQLHDEDGFIGIYTVEESEFEVEFID